MALTQAEEKAMKSWETGSPALGGVEGGGLSSHAGPGDGVGRSSSPGVSQCAWRDQYRLHWLKLPVSESWESPGFVFCLLCEPTLSEAQFSHL